MSDSEPNRCGYMWPPDHQADDNPDNQSCCWRPTLVDSERCAWHADPEHTDEKTIAALQEVRPDPDVRNQTSPVGELLNGAVLTGIEVGDSIPLSRVALKDSQLTNVNLKRADLTDTSLTWADLTGAQLQEADLTGAQLQEADLTGAQLQEADLTTAFLFETDLSDAGLEETSLRDANLFRADLTGGYIKEADLTNVSAYYTDFTNATLARADLTGASFRRADLNQVSLNKADLTNADLEGADVTETSLIEADLTNADLKGADLTESNLRSTTLTDTEFRNSTLRGAALPKGDTLREAVFTEANLEGHDLRQQNLSGVTMRKANLTDADLSGADMSEADLERALLSRADLFDTRLEGAQLEGAVFGNVQINEGTFEQMGPESAEIESRRSLGARLKALVLGPVGDDAYRCVYDPASAFELGKANDEQTNSTAPGDRTANDSDKQTHDGSAIRAGGVYQQLERLAGDNALPDWQQRFFILRQDMQTRQKTGLDYLFAVVQRALFGYGESFGRVVGWSGVIIGLFSMVYLAGGWIHPVTPDGGLERPISWTQLPGDPSVIWESVYYSTLTFTALGFGDFRPRGTVGQFFTILETASGALLLALVVFVLGRRAAR